MIFPPGASAFLVCNVSLMVGGGLVVGFAAVGLAHESWAIGVPLRALLAVAGGGGLTVAMSALEEGEFSEIPAGTIRPVVQEAVTSWPEYFRAGTLDPDAAMADATASAFALDEQPTRSGSESPACARLPRNTGDTASSPAAAASGSGGASLTTDCLSCGVSESCISLSYSS